MVLVDRLGEKKYQYQPVPHFAFICDGNWSLRKIRLIGPRFRLPCYGK